MQPNDPPPLFLKRRYDDLITLLLSIQIMQNSSGHGQRLESESSENLEVKYTPYLGSLSSSTLCTSSMTMIPNG